VYGEVIDYVIELGSFLSEFLNFRIQLERPLHADPTDNKYSKAIIASRNLRIFLERNKN
jgi:hypothetical protein